MKNTLEVVGWELGIPWDGKTSLEFTPRQMPIWRALVAEWKAEDEMYIGFTRGDD